MLLTYYVNDPNLMSNLNTSIHQFPQFSYVFSRSQDKQNSLLTSVKAHELDPKYPFQAIIEQLNWLSITFIIMFANLMIFVNCFIIADTGIYETAAKEKVCYKRLMNWAMIREIEVAESKTVEFLQIVIKEQQRKSIIL